MNSRWVAVLACALFACGGEIAEVECTSNDECAPGLVCIGGDCRRGDAEDAEDGGDADAALADVATDVEPDTETDADRDAAPDTEDDAGGDDATADVPADAPVTDASDAQLDAVDARDAGEDVRDDADDPNDADDANDAIDAASDAGGCTSDDACGSEEICEDGTCAPSECSCVGDACLLDNECDVLSEMCALGRCAPPPCGTHLFAFDPEGDTYRSVHIAGEFNASGGTWPRTIAAGGWPLVWDDELGLWLGRFEVGEGRWLYKLVLDESDLFTTDPANPDREPDAFGGFNSVLTILCGSTPGLCGDAEAFDWRDVVLYHLLVDRFYDSDGVAMPVPGATDGDATTGPSAQYEGGDLAGVSARMGYLAELGVSGLWISAPYDNADSAGSGDAIGQPGRMFSAYHGYWPTPMDISYRDPASPTPTPRVESRIGSTSDLRAMVSAAHAADVPSGHGLRVVFSHSARFVHTQSLLYQEHPTWFTDHGLSAPRLCGPESLWDDPFWGTRCWFTDFAAAFDADVSAARGWVAADATWWVDDFGIDGLFLDAITQLDPRIIAQIRSGLSGVEAASPAGRLALLGQTFAYDERELIAQRVDPGDALDGQLDFPLKARLCEAVFRSDGSLATLAGWLDTNDDYYGADALMMPWIGNADVPRAIHFASGEITNCREGSYPGNSWTDSYDQPTEPASYERLALAFAVLLTQPGMPVIYYGDEIGLAGGGDPDNRRMMPWDDGELLPAQLRLRDSVTALLHARAEYRVLSRGERVTLSASDDTWVYVMTGCDGTSPDVTVAMNRANTSRTVTVPPGSYVNVLTDANVTGGAMVLPPRSYVVLAPR